MLRKFVFSLAMALVAFAGFAQETVYETSRALDNTYVSVTVGANTDATGFCDNLYPELNVYFGKWFTPVVGAEVNGELDCWNSFKSRSCFVKQSYVGIAGMVDLANMFCGYNPVRKFHIVPFVGIGWLHGYVNNIAEGTVNVPAGVPYQDTNDIATKMGINMMLNLGKSVSLNLRPTIMYNLTAPATPRYDVRQALIGLELGVTYRFGSFTTKTVVPYSKYENLMNKVNELRARANEVDTVIVREVCAVPAETVVVATNVTKVTDTEIVVPAKPENVHVGFTINSSDISYTQLPNIAAAAQYLNNNTDATVRIYGYADAGTGSSEYNLALSRKRAENVANALTNMGVDVSRITVIGEGSATQAYPVNAWNRAAIIEFVK